MLLVPILCSNFLNDSFLANFVLITSMAHYMQRFTMGMKIDLKIASGLLALTPIGTPFQSLNKDELKDEIRILLLDVQRTNIILSNNSYNNNSYDKTMYPKRVILL